jgi:heme/copper-type cytochrome/quinol oxidase subunit 2
MKEIRAALPAAWAAVLFLLLCAEFTHAGRRVQTREFSMTGNDFAFAPAMIEVHQNDLVRVTFQAQDIPHTFTIDEYRIAKRAAAGQAVVIEFRADRAGRFEIYCSLTTDDRCRRMKGQLIVRP